MERGNRQAEIRSLRAMPLDIKPSRVFILILCRLEVLYEKHMPFLEKLAERVGDRAAFFTAFTLNKRFLGLGIRESCICNGGAVFLQTTSVSRVTRVEDQALHVCRVL